MLEQGVLGKAAAALISLLVGSGDCDCLLVPVHPDCWDYCQCQKSARGPGRLSVSVVDENGAAVPGVLVEARSKESNSCGLDVSNDQGRALLRELVPSLDYVVTATLEGFSRISNKNVEVRSNEALALTITMALATLSEEIVVQAESPVVDVTSTLAGFTLPLTQALPTARSYQDYLQLVPGVVDSKPRSANILGSSGGSQNLYYLDGIDVTDAFQSPEGASLDSGIIQAQSVLTAGFAAEYGRAAGGVILDVVTKSGGNQFAGSAGYYLQSQSLAGDNERFPGQVFESGDTAINLGGPILKNHAWFFAGLRDADRDDVVVSPDSAQISRTVEEDVSQRFLKLVWERAESDLLTGIFLSDSTDATGQRDNAISNAHDHADERSSDRHSLRYQRAWSAGALDLGYSESQSDLERRSAVPRSLNEVGFRFGDAFTQREEQLGGAGDHDVENSDSRVAKGALELLRSGSWGTHEIKLGFELERNDELRDLNYVNGERYTSISNRYLGDHLTNRELIQAFSILDFDALDPSDYAGFIAAVNASARRGEFYSLFDANGDGMISADELADNLVHDSTSGNPDGQINYGRRVTLLPQAASTRSEGTTLFLQDKWELNNWTLNAGVRSEKWEHFAPTGDSVFAFEHRLAPRVGIAYDIKGNGRQGLSLFYGRYYTPPRVLPTSFMDSLTARKVAQQVYVSGLDEWVTYRVRGGVDQLSKAFAPRTRTPYVDEWQAGYKADLGRNMSLEAKLLRRETRDVLDDYDTRLYADPTVYPGPADDSDSLFLGADFFGFPAAELPDSTIMTLPAGHFNDRDSFSLIFRKRYSDNWQMIASYDYASNEGNADAGSRLGSQGDVLWRDPRSPNQTGARPGSVEQVIKLSGSYGFDNGFEIGGLLRLNSGSHFDVSQQWARRRDPVRLAADDVFEFGGITDRWIRPDSVAGIMSPSYASLDLHFSYLWRIGSRFEADMFVDVFNALDEQAAVEIQTRESGGAGFAFEDGTRFLEPRRLLFGARLRF